MILKNKKVVVVGLARTGVAVTKFLVGRGAKVTVTDIKNKTDLGPYLKDLSSLKRVTYELGRHPIKSLLKADFFVVSPGVPLNIPLFDAVRKENINIMSEVELACQFIKQPLVAVTGTNGKTTTTMMIGQMLQNAKKKAFVGGNIGNPLTNLLLTKEKYDVVICEVSSFQLETIEKFKPKISVVLNLTPDHLDRHENMLNYAKIKGRIFENQVATDWLILNSDDEQVKLYSKQAKAKVVFFGKDKLAASQEGIFYKSNQFTLKGAKSVKDKFSTENLKLKGYHNKENFMAAILVAKILKCSNISIQHTLDNFQSVPHRLEFVKSAGYVDFYNDSKATNVFSVAKSLESFVKPLILIMGGKDKDSEFEQLRPLVQEKVKILIVLGQAKEKINRALGDYTETFVVGTLDEAVFMAYQKSRAGDVILFSPGCASFDQFKDFEDRGNRFKDLIREI